MRVRIYEKFLKRILDILISSIALIILFPLLVLIGILVRIKLGSPIIYKQKRPGKKDKLGNEKIFTLYKFRTMNSSYNENGELLPDKLRLTKFGKALRGTSLDELLELINIIKGDMSIVGPRPLLVQYIPLYSEEQRSRHLVRPGLTGLAQINGRNAITWEEKFRFDCTYVQNITFLGDFKIIILTIKKVILKEGVNFETDNASEMFVGNSHEKTTIEGVING